MLILAQFILRLSFGLALAMVFVPPRLVTSGYYRNNLYVLLGLGVLASLIAWTLPASAGLPFWATAAAATVSYVGAVCWLYEKPKPGLTALAIVALLSWFAAWSAPFHAMTNDLEQGLWTLDVVSSGLLIGITTAAMLLGHWYLNAPGMKLAPLQRLVVLMGVAVLLRALVAGAGPGLGLSMADAMPEGVKVWMLVLRWLAGLLGTAIVIVLTWQTLKIPNTQSATGMLYVGVILVYLGELAGQLLSAESVYPL